MDCFSDLVTGLCSFSAFFMLFATAVTTGIGTEFAACLHIWVFGTVILNEFGNPCSLKYSRGVNVRSALTLASLRLRWQKA